MSSKQQQKQQQQLISFKALIGIVSPEDSSQAKSSTIRNSNMNKSERCRSSLRSGEGKLNVPESKRHSNAGFGKSEYHYLGDMYEDLAVSIADEVVKIVSALTRQRDSALDFEMFKNPMRSNVLSSVRDILRKFSLSVSSAISDCPNSVADPRRPTVSNVEVIDKLLTHAEETEQAVNDLEKTPGNAAGWLDLVRTPLIERLNARIMHARDTPNWNQEASSADVKTVADSGTSIVSGHTACDRKSSSDATRATDDSNGRLDVVVGQPSRMRTHGSAVGRDRYESALDDAPADRAYVSSGESLLPKLATWMSGTENGSADNLNASDARSLSPNYRTDVGAFTEGKNQSSCVNRRQIDQPWGPAMNCNEQARGPAKGVNFSGVNTPRHSSQSSAAPQANEPLGDTFNEVLRQAMALLDEKYSGEAAENSLHGIEWQQYLSRRTKEELGRAVASLLDSSIRAEATPPPAPHLTFNSVVSRQYQNSPKVFHSPSDSHHMILRAETVSDDGSFVRYCQSPASAMSGWRNVFHDYSPVSLSGCPLGFESSLTYNDDRDRMVYVSWIPKKARAYSAADKRVMELELKKRLRELVGIRGLTKVLLFPPKGVHCKLIFDCRDSAGKFMDYYGGDNGAVSTERWKADLCRVYDIDLHDKFDFTVVKIEWSQK